MEKQTLLLEEYTAAYTIQGQGIPVILLHGFFGDAWTLTPIIQELQSDYCCIALDLLGFGDSSKPDIKYLIDHQVEFLRQFIAAKKLRGFYLIGYSYGAWVASAYAIADAKLNPVNQPSAAPMNQRTTEIPEQPGCLKGMALIAPAGIRDDSFVGRYNHLKPLLWKTRLVDWLLEIIAPFATLLGKSKDFNPIYQMRQAIVSQPAATALLSARLQPEDAVDTVEQEIHQIAVPTLVIAGEKDPLIPLWHCQTYADNISQAYLEIVPNAGHELVQTHGQEISHLIKDYWLVRYPVL
jgi:pimeloyl-ACP methyl ester carboxylesterase